MDELEKKLSGLPKPKLGKKADLKIRMRLMSYVVRRNIGQFFNFKIQPLRKALYFSAILVAFFGTTSVYALTSRSVTTAHPLYFLKKAIYNEEPLETQIEVPEDPESGTAPEAAEIMNAGIAPEPIKNDDDTEKPAEKSDGKESEKAKKEARNSHGEDEDDEKETDDDDDNDKNENGEDRDDNNHNEEENDDDEDVDDGNRSSERDEEDDDDEDEETTRQPERRSFEDQDHDDEDDRD